MLRTTKTCLLAVLSLLASSCSLDLLDNPNAVNVSNTDMHYLLNRIELDYASHFNQMGDSGMRLTRMLNQGTAFYDNAVSPGTFDIAWTNAYANIMTDVKTLIPIAETSGFFIHAGIARTIKASVLLNLVDGFGDIPYSEALDIVNFNPRTDPGASVYEAALTILDEAIANFEMTPRSGAPGDLYYAGNAANWISAANSLKLKALLNLRLTNKAKATAGIAGLIADGRLIAASGQNFQFKFGSNLTNPDTRHPRYADQYSPSGGGDYQANHYMAALYASKSFPDPRIRYYFYRQTIANPTDVNALRCINDRKPAHYSASDVYCLPTPVGYWGRDHLNDESMPPDGLLRTAWGLYPAGGLYDNDAGRAVSLGAGAGGAGIHPIMLRSYVDFMLAEAALTLGTGGIPRELLKSAIEKSMADIRSFALATIENAKIAEFETAKQIVWADEVTSYINLVLKAYDAAATDHARLNIIATEYWLALYGNGVEAYNLYRRTGMPSNMQPALQVNPGGFARSFYYPTSFVTRNANAVQKSNAAQAVFWDNNPAQIFK
ncbi:SusD/RagB family nutrient-binding outer membrane lipoprotein [Dyadobacter beijingensis]|uniref:SusD/RagB family nutrient-binding outer membrane lipoprotein n=1 Tax=Dyadobacter beijingensis TaxID=365489 RepID=UPI0004777002|nr:SusD/RagB family nutrient-binding outer membrane lipoprotein [Dyadobacter beijingensis]